MNTLKYSIELPNIDGDWLEVEFTATYDTIETDDGTAHDHIAPRTFKEHSVVKITHPSEQASLLINMLYKQQGAFTKELDDYVQENG